MYLEGRNLTMNVDNHFYLLLCLLDFEVEGLGECCPLTTCSLTLTTFTGRRAALQAPLTRGFFCLGDLADLGVTFFFDIVVAIAAIVGIVGFAASSGIYKLED